MMLLFVLGVPLAIAAEVAVVAASVSVLNAAHTSLAMPEIKAGWVAVAFLVSRYWSNRPTKTPKDDGRKTQPEEIWDAILAQFGRAIGLFVVGHLVVAWFAE